MLRTAYDVTTESILKMNWIATYLVSSYFPGEVVVWDSHMALQKKYKMICLKYALRDDPKRIWVCEDALHSGSVVLDHYAQMLLNYLCPV